MPPKREQLDLFIDYNPDPPFQDHSPTSADAARGIEPRTESLRRAVLDYLRGRGAEGATDEAIQEALQMNPSTQRPRRIECVELGLVRDSGRTRPTRSGRQAVVWMAIERKAGSDE